MTRLLDSKRTSQSRRGQDFEDQLEMIHRVYDMKNIACIKKMPVQTVLNKSESGDVYGRVVGKGLSDYMGVVFGGHGIAMEAKETQQKNFSVRIYQKSHNTVHDHQLDFLDRYEKMDGLAIWLVHFAKYEKVFAIQHRQMRTWVPPGRSVDIKVSIDEMRGLGSDVCIEVDKGWQGYDYLEEIKDWVIKPR